LYAFIQPDKCLKCVECNAAKACPFKAIMCIDKFEPKVIEIKYCQDVAIVLKNVQAMLLV
jgi:ferredoxin